MMEPSAKTEPQTAAGLKTAGEIRLVQGANHATKTVSWMNEDGEPVPLAGARLMARTKNRKDGSERDVTGDIRVLNPDAGMLTYKQSADDVAMAGKFYMQFFAVRDGSVDISLLIDLTIDPSIGWSG